MKKMSHSHASTQQCLGAPDFSSALAEKVSWTFNKPTERKDTFLAIIHKQSEAQDAFSLPPGT